jgi:hypothetical protein
MIPSIYDLQTFCRGTPEECLVFQTKEAGTEEAPTNHQKDLSKAV